MGFVAPGGYLRGANELLHTAGVGDRLFNLIVHGEVAEHAHHARLHNRVGEVLLRRLEQHLDAVLLSHFVLVLGVGREFAQSARDALEHLGLRRQ